MVEPTKKLVENFGAGMTDHVLTQGGEAVDRETRAQIMDIYNFYQKFNLNLLEYWFNCDHFYYYYYYRAIGHEGDSYILIILLNSLPSTETRT